MIGVGLNVLSDKSDKEELIDRLPSDDKAGRFGEAAQTAGRGYSKKRIKGPSAAKIDGRANCQNVDCSSEKDENMHAGSESDPETGPEGSEIVRRFRADLSWARSEATRAREDAASKESLLSRVTSERDEHWRSSERWRDKFHCVREQLTEEMEGLSRRCEVLREENKRLREENNRAADDVRQMLGFVDSLREKVRTMEEELQEKKEQSRWQQQRQQGWLGKGHQIEKCPSPSPPSRQSTSWILPVISRTRQQQRRQHRATDTSSSTDDIKFQAAGLLGKLMPRPSAQQQCWKKQQHRTPRPPRREMLVEQKGRPGPHYLLDQVTALRKGQLLTTTTTITGSGGMGSRVISFSELEQIARRPSLLGRMEENASVRKSKSSRELGLTQPHPPPSHAANIFSHKKPTPSCISAVSDSELALYAR